MIIGIHGKKNHGKDTVAMMIQYLFFLNTLKKKDKELVSKDETSLPIFMGFKKELRDRESRWETLGFADKVKEITCLLTGCTREQLEDRVFKEQVIGPEWTVYYWTNDQFNSFTGDNKISKLFTTLEEAEADDDRTTIFGSKSKLVKEDLTYRRLMQLIGTQCGRYIIHPNIWIMATMKDYKMFPNPNNITRDMVTPNWLITDVRFPNEMQAIRNRIGYVIKVFRPNQDDSSTHESEVGLDHLPNDQFDATIVNDGNMIDLFNKVKLMLQNKNLI